MKCRQPPRCFRPEARRAFRRPDRRRRHFRRRQRLSPDDAAAGHEFRHPGKPGEFRRHLADPSLSRHPLRQRPPHLRLSLQAVGRAADRDRRGDQVLHGRGDRRERSRKAHPLPAPDRAGELVERDQSVDRRGGQDRQRRARHLHREFPVDVPGLLPPFGRLHAGMEGHGQPSRAASSIRSSGPRISSSRTRRWS